MDSFERDGDNVPFVFLTISTLAEPDVIYAVGLRQARAGAQEILGPDERRAEPS
jgi:hypothetical protein